MALTARRANALVVVSFLLVMVVTPYLLGYAFDYRLVERPGSEADEDLAVPYEELTAAQREAVDRAIAGDGPWYRTRDAAPIDGSALIVERDGAYHRLVLDDQFHWETDRGKAVAVVFVTGVITGAVALFYHLFTPGDAT